MKKFNRKKFNIFITILIPVLIILAITTIFLTEKLISYVINKSNCLHCGLCYEKCPVEAIIKQGE